MNTYIVMIGGLIASFLFLVSALSETTAMIQHMRDSSKVDEIRYRQLQAITTALSAIVIILIAWTVQLYLIWIPAIQ